MANGGFMFLLLSSLYFMTLVFVNFVFSMYLFRIVHVAGLQCRSLVPIRYTARENRMRKLTILILTFILILSACTKDNPVNKQELNPTVRIINLQNNMSILDSLLIEVEASDDKGIVKVEILIDNQTDSLRTFITPPYRFLWNVQLLADSSVHTVYAKAYDGDGNVSSSAVYTLIAYKFSPSNLKIIDFTESAVSLSWKDNSSVENGFEIEMSENNGPFELVKSVGMNIKSTIIVKTFLTTVNYSFRVRATTNNVKSKYSNSVFASLNFPAPYNLTISSINSYTVLLQWQDSASFESGFQIERSIGSGAFMLFDSVSTNITSFVDSTLNIFNTYKYRIRAYTNYNVSPYSSFLNISYDSSQTIKIREWSGFSGGITDVHIAISPDKSIIASVGAESVVKIWDTKTGLLLKSLSGHSDRVYSVAFDPSGILLATGSYDSTIILWNAKDGTKIRTIRTNSGRVLSINFSFDGVLLVSGLSNNSAMLWRTSDGTLVQTLNGHSKRVLSVLFSPNNEIIATCSEDSTIKLWRTTDGLLLYTLQGHSNAVSSIDFSPDGMLLGSGSYDNTVRLWQVINGSLYKTILAHNNAVLSVKQWQIPLGNLARTITGHSNGVSSIVFSMDGSLFFSADYDHSIIIWGLGSWIILP
jgi:hypothetical protein